MALTFPGETPEYRAARNDLLQKEIEARRAVEAAAAARRALPPGGELKEDYVLHQVDDAGVRREVRLSELFGANDSLLVYSYMFGPDADPCPMCTPLLDGLNGVEDHIRQRASLVVVAESSPERLWAWRRTRGWQRLRLLSVAGTSYNDDYNGRWGGWDTTMLNVFHRSGGSIRHIWGTELAHGPEDPGQHHRGLDALNPVFNAFDMTPVGRGDWTTQREYGEPAPVG